ncbi:MAG: xanthine dehydrogenase family protein [Proteobacteria bacterium]|nr:xanthine dehydrogenase family protein [Pseudomonadota bacterium]
MPFVGENVVRTDAVEKVTGAARYADDIVLPGMWHGAVVRAPIARGRLRSLTLSPSFEWGRAAVARAEDIPGKNCVAMIEDDLPLIVTGEIRHAGEAVLLVAAPTRELARAAAAAVEVECEQLAPVLTMDEAKAAAIKIFGSDNVVHRCEIQKGDVDSALSGADLVVEGTYETGSQEHIYIETQGMVARWEGGRLFVEGSMQCPYYVSRALSVLTGVPEDRISVRQSVVGGAFGGKEDYPSILAGYCAILSRKCGHPVKIVYDRDEDIRFTTKRHPSRVRHRTGVAKDGTLVAMDISFELDAGAYVTLTPVVLSRGAIHAAGPYRCPSVRVRAAAYATNTPPNGAFRGFGAPQALFPVEVHMDRVAEAAGLSPLEFRRRNCLKVGDTTATGQRLTESVAALRVLEEAARRSKFERLAKGHKKISGAIRRGVGLSLFMHGAGFTGSGEAVLRGKAALRLEPEGKISVLTACTDMGQGAHTVLRQMAADQLGLDIGLIELPTPDTAYVPDSGPTVASRTTMIMGSVLAKCAAKLRAELFEFASGEFGVRPERLSFEGGALMHGRKRLADASELIRSYAFKRGVYSVTEEYELPPGIKWDEKSYRGDAYPTYSWGCDVAEVEVDMDTFEVRVPRMWLAQDLGRAINPLMAAGQVEGGTLQALGWALMERVASSSGIVRSDRLQTYIIPTSADAPEMETILVEEPYSRGPMGAKGVGELPMDGPAPAIANAIYAATGIRVSSIPITPERLYEEWRRMK